MILHGALVGTLLLAGQALAHSHALLQRSHDLEYMLRRDANLAASLTRRQDANPADSAPQVSTTPASGNIDGTADLAKWEAETKLACDNAIVALNGRTSNPTGLAVCYNLPFLDNSTGVFQAELRLYNITAPQAPWVGVRAADIDMALSYLGATLQNMDGTFAKRDEIVWSSMSTKSEHGLVQKRQNTNVPETLKVLMYVGRINDNLMGTAMTKASLRPLLIPNIELSATSPSGEAVSTVLDSNEATFVNGVFAEAGTKVDGAAAAASATAAAANAVPFQLPGTKLAFFPVGLVITCTWTAFFFLTVGMGTFGRIQFRDQYRRRVKREETFGMRTI